jgi:hypothetical protein
MVDRIVNKEFYSNSASSSSGLWLAKGEFFSFEKDSLASMKEPLEENSCCDFTKTLFDFVSKPFSIVWKIICSLVSSSMLRSNDLIDFYRGTAANTDGVSLKEIWGWTDEQLEDVHTYIQWLFPSTRPSDFNSNAPILNKETIEAFRQDPLLKSHVLRSFYRMLTFYGLQWNERNGTITRASNCSSRESVWLTHGNHNFLRITRILAFLSHLKLKVVAKAFLAILADISQKEGKGIISSKTLDFWTKAVQVTI